MVLNIRCSLFAGSWLVGVYPTRSLSLSLSLSLRSNMFPSSEDSSDCAPKSRNSSTRISYTDIKSRFNAGWKWKCGTQRAYKDETSERYFYVMLVKNIPRLYNRRVIRRDSPLSATLRYAPLALPAREKLYAVFYKAVIYVDRRSRCRWAK